MCVYVSFGFTVTTCPLNVADDGPPRLITCDESLDNALMRLKWIESLNFEESASTTISASSTLVINVPPQDVNNRANRDIYKSSGTLEAKKKPYINISEVRNIGRYFYAAIQEMSSGSKGRCALNSL